MFLQKIARPWHSPEVPVAAEGQWRGRGSHDLQSTYVKWVLAQVIRSGEFRWFLLCSFLLSSAHVTFSPASHSTKYHLVLLLLLL